MSPNKRLDKQRKLKILIDTMIDQEIPIDMIYKNANKYNRENDNVRSGTFVSEGFYPYWEEGKIVFKFKEYDELKKAYPEGSGFPVFTSHDNHELYGIAFDIIHNDEERAIQGKIYSPKILLENQGVSAEFYAIDHDCIYGICQRDIDPDALALASNPRNDKNRLDNMNEQELQKLIQKLIQDELKSNSKKEEKEKEEDKCPGKKKDEIKLLKDELKKRDEEDRAELIPFLEKIGITEILGKKLTDCSTQELNVADSIASSIYSSLLKKNDGNTAKPFFSNGSKVSDEKTRLQERLLRGANNSA